MNSVLNIIYVYKHVWGKFKFVFFKAFSFLFF